MSVFFQYDVSGDVRASCLGIIDRAAERAARGEQVVLGERKKREKRLGRSTRKRNSVSSTLRQRVFELREQGFSRDQIAAEVRTSRTRVDYILYHIGRGTR